MKMRKEYLVLVTIIVALSLYLALRNPNRIHYQLPDVLPIDQKDISKIEISKPDTSIVLNKTDDSWRIAPEGYLANNDSVGNILDIIETLTVTALVSEAGIFDRYDLHDDNKITVKAWAENTLKREFDVGKVASSSRHTFVKLAGDSGVYHARGNFRTRFDLTVDRLRDKTVLSFNQDDIQEISISGGEESVAFNRSQAPVEVKPSQEPETENRPPEKVETVWQTADGKKVDKTQLDGLLSTLSSLRCERYIDNMKKEDLSNPIYTLKLKGLEEHILSVFAKTDEEANSHPAISSENDYPFLLPKWQTDNLMKKPDELFKETNKPEPR
jgi:hypothetical protein